MKATRMMLVLLALTMVLGMLSVTAFATDSEASTTGDLTVQITHVSLNPAKDALGFKAKVEGSLESVTEIGFAFRVNGGSEKVYTLTKTPEDGIFTARVQNILANKGGEATLEAYAFVVVNGETVKSDWQATSMKEALQAVNTAWYTAGYTQVQKDAVKALCEKFLTQVEPWNLDNIFSVAIPFFGTTGEYNTGAQFNLSQDTGANTGTVTVSDNGIALGYVQNFSEENFYFETKIHVDSIAATENYPKFGLFVQDGGIRHHFYVDMKTDKTSRMVGCVKATNDLYDWSNAKTGAASGMRFADSEEFVTLGLMKIGDDLHFFVNGEHVLSAASSVTGKMNAGVFGFNTGMTLKEYYTDMSEETLKKLQDALLETLQPLTDEQLWEISLDKLTFAADNGASTAVSTWKAEYTDKGVKIFVDVEDEISIDSNHVGMSDNVEFQIQAVHNYLHADGYALNMLCNGEGAYWLRRWSTAENGWVTEETTVDVTAVNDSVYYLFETTDSGYQVEFFISYDMLGVTAEEAKNQVRLFPMLRNRADSTYNVYAALDLYGSQYNYPSTWFVLDENNCFTRSDIDPFYLKNVSAEAEQMLSDLAQITSDYTIYATELGAPVFSNSIWGFDGLARDLYGTDYVRGPKGGGETVTIEQAGYVIVLCSDKNSTMREILNTDGWTLLTDKASNALALAAGTDSNFQYLCSYYGKYFEAGETFTVSGEYAVVFAKAAGTLGQFPWKTTPAYISFDAVNDPYYSEAMNVFNACPSIAVTNGGRLIATYVTGDTNEPRFENSVVVAYSDDGGKTWTNAFVIDSWVDQKIGGTKESIVLECDVRVDPSTNKLYFMYNLRMDRNSYITTNTGTWLFSVDNPDAALSDWNFSEQIETGHVYVRNTFVILSDGRFAIIPNGYFSSEPNYIYFSSDEGKTWTKGGSVYVPQGTNFEEPVIVERLDGSLWALFRTTLGALYESFSYDGGQTWTVAQRSQIQNPCARFNITRLSSGNLMMIYNNTSSGRLGMTIAISTDDGRTWSNRISAFDGFATYPAIALQNKDGEEIIHVIFDSGRHYNTQWQSSEDGTEQYYSQVYHYAFTEEELLAGGDPSAEEVELLAVGDSYTHPNWWNGFYNSLGIYGAETIGIGGTKVEEWNNDAKLAEVIAKAPQRLFINLGINDIGAGTDGETLGTNLVAYLQALQTALPETDIYYNLIVYPANTAWSYSDIDTANAITKAYIEADTSGKLHYIDIRSKLVVDGTVDATKFTDGLHLSATGYAILTEAIKEATGIGIPISDLNLIRQTTKTVSYDFDSVEYVDLGTVGGTNTNAFNAYIAEKDGNLYFKAETTAAVDASLEEGVDFFLHFGDQTYTARTENTYCFNLYTNNGTATGSIYNYPNAGKSAALGIANVYRKVVVQDGVTTLYGVMPIGSVYGVDASKISVSLTSVKGSGFDTWTYKSQTVDRFKPLYYVALHSDNTISKDLTAEEFEKLMSTAGVYQENKPIIENMAVISTTGTMQVIDMSDCLFSDRLTQNYTFDANLPDFMFGMDYAYNPISSGNFTVQSAGYVIVIVPGGSAYTTTRTKFEDAGFAKILSDWNKMASLIDPLNYYVKWCEAGESYSFGKWNVAIGQIGHDFESIEYASLGEIGGTKTSVFNVYAAIKDGYVYFKAETTATVDASVDEGVDFFLHFGDQTYTARTENTYCFNLYTNNGAATGSIYNYPKAAKSAALEISNAYRKVVVQDGVTTLYGALPIESLNDVDASKIAVSLTSVKGSGVDTWTYKSQTVDRSKPLYYVVLHSDNTISKDLTAAEFEKLMGASSVYQDDKPLLENMAVISTTGTMQVIDMSDCLFSDRLTQNFTFDANLPDFMFGMDYAYNPISSGNFTVQSAGYVIVIVPGGSAYTTTRTKFEDAGFAKILSDWNKMASLTDPLNYYVKWCEAGESYSFGKWNVAIAEQ